MATSTKSATSIQLMGLLLAFFFEIWRSFFITRGKSRIAKKLGWKAEPEELKKDAGNYFGH